MYVALILFGGALFLTAGDIVFKYWSGHGHAVLYGIGLALYLVGLIFLVRSYKFANIEVASALIVIFNIIILTIVGWLYFKEHISGTEILGIMAGLVSIFLLERS